MRSPWHRVGLYSSLSSVLIRKGKDRDIRRWTRGDGTRDQSDVSTNQRTPGSHENIRGWGKGKEGPSAGSRRSMALLSSWFYTSDKFLLYKNPSLLCLGSSGGKKNLHLSPNARSRKSWVLTLAFLSLGRACVNCVNHSKAQVSLSVRCRSCSLRPLPFKSSCSIFSMGPGSLTASNYTKAFQFPRKASRRDSMCICTHVAPAYCHTLYRMRGDMQGQAESVHPAALS